jgi:hypothetical protein
MGLHRLFCGETIPFHPQKGDNMAVDDLQEQFVQLREFIERAAARERGSAAYRHELGFEYKGRDYFLQQALYLDTDGKPRYQQYLLRDGRLLNIGALRKTLDEMRWDLRYTAKAESLYG